MNITSNINLLTPLNISNDKIMKDLGFKKYQRNIHFFMKQNKNVYNIEGNNIITKICCLITNKSVIENRGKITYDKTTYLCDVEFPEHCGVEVIKKNIIPFIEAAKITPTYVFENNHCIVLDKNQLYDFGLTMVDVGVSNSSVFGLFNFSNNKQSDPMFKEAVYSNRFNPKFYNHVDAEVFNNDNDDESNTYSISDLRDNNTTIEYSLLDSEISTLINNVLQDTYCIDKKMIGLNEFITSFFNKWLFLQFESIEIIYNTKLEKPLGIKNLRTFYPFEEVAKEHFIDLLFNDITICLNNLEKTLNEPFYLVLSINNRNLILDITFFNENDKRIRILKPLYKLYGEFALESEEIISEIESNTELAKCDMLEQLENNVRGLEMVNDISNAINMLDSAANTLIMNIEDNKSRLENLIGNNKNRKMIENK